MGNYERAPLTEPMFYILMSFLHSDMCGTQITHFVRERTQDRVKLGPGTLYTLLNKFLEEGAIQEVAVSGRKRTYRITPYGLQLYRDELRRLHNCLTDAAQEENHSVSATPGLLPAAT